MPPPTSPYVGLVPYSEEDEPYFFGRTQERRTVAFNLRAARLTLLYGPSGVGKSSLLRAGVTCDLQKLARENQQVYKCPELIVVVFRSWGDDPIRDLIAAIAQAGKPFLPPDKRPALESDLVRSIKRWSEALTSDILIILDQFEDYFLYVKSSSAEAFAQGFSEAVNSSALRTNFLVSIREDALSKLDVFKGRIPRLFDNYLRIEYLRAPAAREAIKEPIRVFNEASRAEHPYTVEKKLINAVINQIAVGRVGPATQSDKDEDEDVVSPNDAQPVETTLLQMVMRRIWDEELKHGSHNLQLSTLRELGNTRRIVRSYLDKQMDALSVEKKQIAAETFNHLVTPSGLKVAHTVTDLARYTNHDEEVLQPVLLELTGARILRLVPPAFESDVSRFEISHEVLAPAVRGWFSRYNEAKETEAERARLEAEMADLKKKEKQARAKARTAWILFGVFLAFSIALALLAAYAWRQARKAKQAEGLAQAAEQASTQILNNMNLLERSLPSFHAVLRGHNQPVIKALFSPAGTTIVTISDDGTARSWNPDTGETIFVQELKKPVHDMAFNSTGRRVAIANADQITLWDPVSNQTEYLKGHQAAVRKLAFDPTDDQYLASADEIGTTIVWRLSDNTAYRTLLGYHKGPIYDIKWNPKGVILVTAGFDKTAHIWDGRTGSHQHAVSHEGPINCVVFNPDGRELLTCSDDFTARIWKVIDGTPIRTLQGHGGPVYSAAFGSERIVTASADRTARLWDARTREQISILPAETAEVKGVRLSRDETRLITWGGDRISRVWDVATGKLLYKLVAPILATQSADLSPNGKLAVTANSDYNARVWDVGEAEFKIKDLKLSIEPNYYVCPAVVRLFGRIQVEAAGIVKYRFVVRGRGPGPERSLSFDGPGSKDVGAFYRFPESAGSVNGSVYLWVTYPEDRKSNSAQFKVDCSTTSEPKPEPTPRIHPQR